MSDGGLLAIREYSVVLSDGTQAVLSFALCSEANSVPSRFAREQGAQAYGLIMITGVDDAPRTPAIWILRGDKISVTVGQHEPSLTPAIKEAIREQMLVYFAEIADLVPPLSGVELKPRTLH